MELGKDQNQEFSALTNIGPTVTDAPYVFSVPVKWHPPINKQEPIKRTLLEKLLNKPLPVPPATPEPETERTFTIFPCLVGNMYRIASRAARLPSTIFDGDMVQVLLPLIPLHMPDMVYIIGAAIQNNHLEPDPELLMFIERNFTQRDVFEALYASLEGVGLQVFYNSIASVKGTVKIIQPGASPLDGKE